MARGGTRSKAAVENPGSGRAEVQDTATQGEERVPPAEVEVEDAEDHVGDHTAEEVLTAADVVTREAEEAARREKVEMETQEAARKEWEDRVARERCLMLKGSVRRQMRGR